MENTEYKILESSSPSKEMAKTFVANVFSWMFFGLMITGVLAYWFGNNLEYIRLLVTETGMTPLGYIVMFAPIGFVLLMSFAFNKLSYPALLALFLAYSAVMGISLSFIFLIYDIQSIYLTFGITSATFGLMAVLGYTTHVDLTKFGSLMMMGLFGIVIASLINMFLGSEKMDYIISIVGVIVFTGLTAYDVQKIKRMGSEVESGTSTAGKLAIMGALTLYLDFVNLFLMLLRLFGSRK